MKVLIWNAPWFSQGDILFYKNCFLKHLIPQANTLLNQGCTVDLVINDVIKNDLELLNGKANLINLDIFDIQKMMTIISDPSIELYKRTNGYLIEKIKNVLYEKLAKKYDVILLWETPVPFLEEMYPESLIVHQMPGAFSRPPYPHTVTFDPVGLYKDGSLYKNFDWIQSQNLSVANKETVSTFISQVKKNIRLVQPFSEHDFDPKNQFRSLKLLPLQVTNHYAFKADTPYESQADFLVDVLTKSDPEAGIIITQYISKNIQDCVLTPDVISALKNRWHNIIHNDSFNTISSASQFILPFSSEVISCSSSIAIQAMAWNIDINVENNTFLKPYSKENIINKEDVYQKTLSFILNKQQPLAKKITSDGKFLTNLLEELIKNKKQNKQELVEFSSIDASYNDELISSFNLSRTEKEFRRIQSKKSPRLEELDKFRRFSSRNEIKFISFDVFDTLIKRPVEVPADVYHFIESIALDETNGITEDFAKVRLNAEIETRKQTTKGEISIYEIYDYIKEHYSLDQNTIEKLIEIELNTEVELITRRDAGYNLWKIAKESGKKIYIVSDMYLPEETIRKMLEKTGYSGYEKLYVSSTYGVRKKEGGLFDILINDLKCKPENILHIGDNKAADIDQPSSKGMKAFRIPRALDRFRLNPTYKNIFDPRNGVGDKSRSAIVGLIASKLFDTPSGELEKASLFQKNISNLGYATLGPMVTAYMLWMGRKAKDDKISRLYFLSREGWLLKQIYDELFKNDIDAVPSFYLYCSRRAARIAALKDIKDIIAVASQPYKEGITLSNLIKGRFGVDISIISNETLNRNGFTNIENILLSNTEHKVKFTKFCKDISEFILESTFRERENYLSYLRSVGFIDEIKPAIVDIGWKANMQGSLGNLIKKPLSGYYYCTTQGAEKWVRYGHKINSFSGDFVTKDYPSTPVNYRHLTEFLVCHSDKSLVKISNINNNLIPIFRNEQGHGSRKLFIDELHSGAIEFAHDLAFHYSKYINQLYIDPALSERVFTSFIKNPLTFDAELLQGKAFEDSFGGINFQYIISPNSDRYSIWKEGAESIFRTNKQKMESKSTTTIRPIEPKVKIRTSPLLLKIERIVVKYMTSDRKFNKYDRDRSAFFIDSKSYIAKRWFFITNEVNNHG